jgi:DNA mismatch endonuclease (patch repair protein)
MADNMTPEQRSRTMARIRSKHSRAELALRRLLFRQGMRFRLHASGLPGRPDIVFPASKVAVFMDGDFWHGWRFEEWAHKLAPVWRSKIERNRNRDAATTVQLKRLGWRVVRIWEHQVEQDAAACVARIIAEVNRRSLHELRRTCAGRPYVKN